ncbi:right-handed parallel beta-helix repeat-containing protein [Treponema sp. TIM-1]|uniref:hypothetical protein n=1 Tax=Treponema sp. TIM-1 TaxID=2898417 RepID=UPI003980D75B
MKGFTALVIFYPIALLIAGCAVPLGEDYLITRDGTADITYVTDYKLQNYVPIPKTGERPVILVNNRGDLDISVVWKNSAGKVPLPFEIFAADTVYQAEIRLTAKPGYSFYPTPFVYPAGKIDTQIDDLGDTLRTVTVTYHNSDDADITFITDYNLQSYIPVPMAGERPVRAVNTRVDMTVEVTWKAEQSPDSGTFVNIAAPDAFIFKLGAVYQADISLAAKPGYRFSAGKPFIYPDGTVITPHGSDTDPDLRLMTVTYTATRTPTKINDFDLTPYIPKPIKGVMAVISFAGSQYTGTVIWKNTETQAVLAGPFQSDTEYTAEVTLTPALGYTFTEIGHNVFTHTGAKIITGLSNDNLVRINFSPAVNAGSLVVYDTILTGRIPKPVVGVTPVTGIAGPQYAGTVTWVPPHSPFQSGTSYTAVLTLNAAPGYTFAGIGQNIFSHRDAPGAVTNAAGSGTVRINFSDAAASAFRTTSFGPVETEGSALWVMKERKDDIYTLSIDLSAGSEDIAKNVTLIAGNNSPGNVTINGLDRTLRVVSPGTLFTVGAGVTLTLQNITLQGYNANTAPLVTVLAGGKLILEEGVTLMGNQTTSEAGGVLVKGGELNLNPGSVIKKMTAQLGGGVLLDNGRLILKGGTVGGENSGDGNTAVGEYSGGGLFVRSGVVSMYGGTIQFNRAEAKNSAGGVHVSGGTFNQYGGTIRENTAEEISSGGGVYFGSGNFTMNNTAALINNNWAEKADSGGGVYMEGGYFVMNFGTIKENTAEEINSGGGIYVGNGNFTMNNTAALITSNTAKKAGSGGGMYTGGSVDINAGTIADNDAYGENSGGGLYVANGGAGIYAGIIKENTAHASGSGGGIYITNGGTCYVEDGNITRNSASYSGAVPDSDSGGAVYIAQGTYPYYGGTFAMYGGTIGGAAREDANTAVIGANGVYVAVGRFNLHGGEIRNTVGTNDYGVYVKDSTFGAFSMGTSAAVHQDNKVFLCTDATITIVESLSSSTSVANIICGTRPVSYIQSGDQATKFLSCSTSTPDYIHTNKRLFLYNDNPVEITDGIEGTGAEGSYCYGYYNEPPTP